MKKLTRQDCLSANDLVLEEFYIDSEGWEGLVYLKKLSSQQQFEFGTLSQGKNTKDLMPKLIVMCVCDEEGNQLFSDADIPALHKKSADTIMKIFNAIMDANFKDSKDVEDMSKNS